VAGGDGLAGVAGGGDEVPFGGGFGFAARRQAADAGVVLDVAVGGFGDVALLAVGGEAGGDGQQGGHGGGVRVVPVLAVAAVAGGVFQVAALAGGDQPGWPGGGDAGFGAVR
jgi:hypothetical protein